jgi:hypothetical protein
MQSHGLVPATAFEAGAKFGDSASTMLGPDHARLLKTGGDDMFAATFDGARANLETVGAIKVVAHALLVVMEVG